MTSPAPLPLKPLRWIHFPGFPNPHIRSSGFVVPRELLVQLEWPDIRQKQDAWRFENGRKSLSAQLRSRGLELIVAGRDGVGYPVDQWHESETFRAGEQANLIIADNRTEDYARADEAQRKYLSGLAWGSAEQ
jgi:hypothetical protein